MLRDPVLHCELISFLADHRCLRLANCLLHHQLTLDGFHLPPSGFVFRALIGVLDDFGLLHLLSMTILSRTAQC